MPRTQAENREYRRASLITACIETVAEHGVDGATIAKICHRAGASRGMSAHYFDSKQALLSTSFAEMFDQAMTVKREIAAQSLAPLDKLRQCSAAVFTPPNFSWEIVAAWQAFGHASRFDKEYAALIRKNDQQLYNLFNRLFADLEPLLNVASDEATRGLLALFDGLWSQVANQRTELSAEQAKACCNRYINGCLKQSTL